MFCASKSVINNAEEFTDLSLQIMLHLATVVYVYYTVIQGSNRPTIQRSLTIVQANMGARPSPECWGESSNPNLIPADLYFIPNLPLAERSNFAKRQAKKGKRHSILRLLASPN